MPYDVTILLEPCEKKPTPSSGAGFGYGVLFDARHSRMVVQFGDKMCILLGSDIFDLFSISNTRLPNAYKAREIRDTYWAEYSTDSS